MSDSRGIMKVNFVTRKKRRGDIESRAQKRGDRAGKWRKKREEREKMPKKESSGGRRGIARDGQRRDRGS